MHKLIKNYISTIIKKIIYRKAYYSKHLVSTQREYIQDAYLKCIELADNKNISILSNFILDYTTRLSFLYYLELNTDLLY